MFIQIDLSNPKPAYLQIVESVRRAIATGALKPGDQLPTIREVAVESRVNRNTVSRAYLELEHQGLVTARQGSGCYVTDNGLERGKAGAREVLQQLASELAMEAHLSQVPIEDVTEMVRESAKQWNRETDHD